MSKTGRTSTRELLHLAWPVLIAQLAMMGSAVIDTAMAGRLSAVDLAAVGIASSIAATVLMSLISVLLALMPIIAHLYGAGRHEEIGHEIHQSIWISFALALIAVLLLRFPEPFIAISELQPDVEIKVRAYLAASSWGVPGVIALRLFLGLTTGIGQPRPAMIFNLLSLALKFPLNAVFMYGLLGMPELGGPGCAVASAVDATLIAVLAWGWCLRNSDYAAFRLHRKFVAPEWKAIMDFLRLGVPIGVTFVADVTAFTLMALFIARLGPVISGAHQIAANLAAFAFMVPLALGNATSVLVGQALGANQSERARQICWEGLRLGMAIAVTLCLLFYFGASHIATLYTTDENVQAVAIPLIVLVGIYHLGDAMQVITVNALRGYKKSVVPMIVYAVGLWTVALGGGYMLGLTDVFGAAHGAAGFWIAGIAGIGMVGIAMTIYLDALSRARSP
ncbi:MAG: MATE family efflux transporter [Methylobacillus sp.]|jgi:MATE family multidrug resistance protein|nr:MATE family efflux transporter [Methylobacillus sp.]